MKYPELPLLTCSVNDTALECYIKMNKALVDHAAAPILNEKAELVGTISASDVRGMTTESFPALLLPVQEFIRSRHALRGVAPPAPVTCTVRTTIGYIITQMLDHHVHRTWVIDSDRHCVGVVSMTDILSKFGLLG